MGPQPHSASNLSSLRSEPLSLFSPFLFPSFPFPFPSPPPLLFCCPTFYVAGRHIIALQGATSGPSTPREMSCPLRMHMVHPCGSGNVAPGGTRHGPGTVLHARGMGTHSARLHDSTRATAQYHLKASGTHHMQSCPSFMYALVQPVSACDDATSMRKNLLIHFE